MPSPGASSSASSAALRVTRSATKWKPVAAFWVTSVLAEAAGVSLVESKKPCQGFSRPVIASVISCAAAAPIARPHLRNPVAT